MEKGEATIKEDVNVVVVVVVAVEEIATEDVGVVVVKLIVYKIQYTIFSSVGQFYQFSNKFQFS